jgi:hypothetical protein
MEVVGDIISENQTTFFRGRNILEGVLVLHEVIHESQSKKLSGIILKLDFEKAYDRVHWDGMGYVIWGGVNINVNNEQGKYFRTFVVDYLHYTHAFKTIQNQLQVHNTDLLILNQQDYIICILHVSYAPIH